MIIKSRNLTDFFGVWKNNLQEKLGLVSSCLRISHFLFNNLKTEIGQDSLKLVYQKPPQFQSA